MPLIPAVESALLKHKAQIEENKRFYGNTYDARYLDYVCVEENGKIVYPDHMTKKFADLLKEKNLRHIRLHDLRHSCASTFRWVEISSRDRLADLFESVLPADADEEMRAKARGKALKAPMCMALVGTGLSPDSQDREADERLMTAGASLMNFLAGLHAQGFAAKAVSAKDFPAPDGLYDPTCERLLCFVLVGTPDTPVNYQDIGMGNDERQPLSRW